MGEERRNYGLAPSPGAEKSWPATTPEDREQTPTKRKRAGVLDWQTTQEFYEGTGAYAPQNGTDREIEEQKGEGEDKADGEPESTNPGDVRLANLGEALTCASTIRPGCWW